MTNDSSKLNEELIRRNRLLIVSIIIILIVTLTPANGKMLGSYLDKVGHFLIFFFFGINCCFKFQKNEKLTEVLFWGIIFGLITEVIQQFIPGRNMDVYDGIADTLGIIFGYYVYRMNKIKLDRLLLKLGA